MIKERGQVIWQNSQRKRGLSESAENRQISQKMSDSKTLDGRGKVVDSSIRRIITLTTFLSSDLLSEELTLHLSPR